jgi:hypothetical protein
VNPTSTCLVCNTTFEVERVAWRPNRPKKSCSSECRLALARKAGSHTYRPPGPVTEPYSNDIAAATYWPLTVIDGEKVYETERLLGRGMSPTAIGTRVGLGHEQVQRIRDYAWKYDPYVDEVAVERALGGDRSVLPRLTIRERAELRLRMVEHYIAEPHEPGSVHWLSTLASSWGTSFERLRDMISQRASRMAA